MNVAGIEIDYDVARAILVLHRSGRFDTVSIGRVLGESEPRVCRVIDAARAGFAVAVNLAMAPVAAPHPDLLPSHRPTGALRPAGRVEVPSGESGKGGA